MFRTIISRRSSSQRSLFTFSSPRSFNTCNNSKSHLITLPLRSYTRPGSIHHHHPGPLSKELPRYFFSTTELLFINEGKAKLEKERENALQQKLESNPEKVTTTSSMTPILDPRPKMIAAHNESGDDPDMLRGLRSDLRTIKETFELNEVPKEALYIGIGGLIPYLGTSLSTLYLAWDINYSQENGMGYLISEEISRYLLHTIEPLQVGLGAIILSFLGAVHWGLEMAEYGGKHTYKRYSLSILAPVLAWPTLLLPVNMALITQFIGFTGMYFADSTATSKGWAPKWYMTYRFLLTFIVGASIVMTLVGRGQIGDTVSKLPGPAGYLQDLRDSQWENLRKEENERKRQMVKEGLEGGKVGEKQESAAEKKDDKAKSSEGKGDSTKEAGREEKKGEGKSDSKKVEG